MCAEREAGEGRGGARGSESTGKAREIVNAASRAQLMRPLAAPAASARRAPACPVLGSPTGPTLQRGQRRARTARRAASQQAGPEPGHCRGRGRMLLPNSMRVLGQLGRRLRACPCAFSVLEVTHGAEQESRRCVLCRMFGSQFVQKTTMLWGDDKKKVVKKGNEWVSQVSTRSRHRAALVAPACGLTVGEFGQSSKFAWLSCKKTHTCHP